MQFHRADCVPDGKTKSRWSDLRVSALIMLQFLEILRRVRPCVLCLSFTYERCYPCFTDEKTKS